MYDFSRFDAEIEKTKKWLQAEIAGIRAGRAHPQLVEHITVDYYGQPTPLQHVAAITVQDPKTIVIQAWDKNAIPAIEKAIASSEIGIQPVVDKDIIRLSFPELTGERRAALVKIVKEKLEDARIAIRNARHDTWNDIQEKEEKKDISEDEKFRFKDDLQKKVDDITEKLEEIAEHKIKEVEA